MEISKQSFIDLIKFPICTEKTIRLLQQNQYSFAVDPKAKKSTIKQAVDKRAIVTLAPDNSITLFEDS